jgi:hypothetical protein
MMLHVVEVCAQVEINHPRLALHNRLLHPCHGLVSGSLWPVSVRAWLEIRLKDRLKDEFERPLNHAISDARDLENSLSSPTLWYRMLPRRQRSIASGAQFIPQLRQKRLHSPHFDGVERDAVDSRRTVIGFGHRVVRISLIVITDFAPS